MCEPDSPQPNNSSERILSVPGLAAALRHTASSRKPAPTLFSARSLVPMYRLNERLAEQDTSDEAAAVATVVSDVSERLRRMGAAYGEWERFDGSAYFDLMPAQYEWLVQVAERVNTVNIIFYMDLLMPSFRAAETYWRNDFSPAYLAAHPSGAAQGADQDADQGVDAFATFFETVQPQMVARWQRLQTVVQLTRDLLIDDIGWMATNGGQEERFQHRAAWQQPAADNLDAALRPSLQTIPTLVRSFEFMLPAHRQSGRQQRLRRNRERARRDEQRTH